MSFMDTIKSSVKAASHYLSERFTKEKISTWGGVLLAFAGAAGYISGPQASLINLGLSAMNIHLAAADPNTIATLTGALAVLAPTSKITQRLKNPQK